MNYCGVFPCLQCSGSGGGVWGGLLGSGQRGINGAIQGVMERGPWPAGPREPGGSGEQSGQCEAQKGCPVQDGSCPLAPTHGDTGAAPAPLRSSTFLPCALPFPLPWQERVQGAALPFKRYGKSSPSIPTFLSPSCPTDWLLPWFTSDLVDFSWHHTPSLPAAKSDQR